ncbi:hypothetical protein D4R75_14340 [bacterium]|nr:MAG: hypothetical protein D4R75_14340 [bacterium]
MKTIKLTSWHFALILAAVVLFLTDRNSPSAPQTQAPSPGWQVYFSPRAGATSAILQTIDNGTSTVFVQAFSLTWEPIVQAQYSNLYVRTSFRA